MRVTTGRIREIQLNENSLRTAWIDCAQEAVPEAGRYLLAWDRSDSAAPLATPIYLMEARTPGFRTAPRIPAAWEPGTELRLQGPNGRGFLLPEWSRRLAVVALDETASRLLPVIHQALTQNTEVAFFSGDAPPRLSSEVEIHPLADLPDGLAWADFLVLDLSIQHLPHLRQVPGLHKGHEALTCPAQAFVLTSIVCGGSAECGACAVPVWRGWKMACQDGPVFDLHELEW